MSASEQISNFNLSINPEDQINIYSAFKEFLRFSKLIVSQYNHNGGQRFNCQQFGSYVFTLLLSSN